MTTEDRNVGETEAALQAAFPTSPLPETSELSEVPEVAPDLDDPAQFEDAGVVGETVPGWEPPGPQRVPPTAYKVSPGDSAAPNAAPNAVPEEVWTKNLSPSAVLLPEALGRQAAEVARYWESIELLTPPDFESDERTVRWRLHPEIISEQLARTSWTKSILEGDTVVVDLNAPAEELKSVLPVFRVMVGVIPKRAYYAHVMRTLRVPGTEASDVDGLDNIRGDVFLASFELNPWGRLVEDSFGATGAVGVLDLLRLCRKAKETNPRIDDQSFLAEDAARRLTMIEARFREAAVRQLQWVPPEKRQNWVAERTKLDGLENPAADANGTKGAPGKVPSSASSGVSSAASSATSAEVQEALDDAKPVRFRNLVAGSPVTPEWIEQFAARLAERIGWEGSVGIAVRVEYESPSRNLDPRRDLLGSFYLADLASVRQRLSPENAAGPEGTPSSASGTSGAGTVNPINPVDAVDAKRPAFVRPAVGAPLARLMRGMLEMKSTVAGRRDVLSDPESLKPFLSPAAFPSGRWPLDQHQHLYVAQQGAVAMMAAGARAEPDADPEKLLDRLEPRLLAVNGPPGTGKSFILRDIIADIVTARAERIAALDASAQLFENGPKVTFTDWETLCIIRVPDPVVTGDGVIVVASNNNAAIRNITDDLPNAFSLDAKTRPDYWSEPAGAFLWATNPNRPAGRMDGPNGSLLRQRRRRFIEGVWGLASATLGRSSNCAAFVRTVLRRRKRDASKPPRPEDIPTVSDRLTAFLSKEEQAKAEARWQEAKAAFLAAKDKVESLRAVMLAREGRMTPSVYTTSLRQKPEQHKTSVWVDGAFERARSELFLAAMDLHRATMEAQAAQWIENLTNIGRWLMNPAVTLTSGRAADIFETLSILVPVISTTLASVGRLLSGVGPGEIGWVFVDEASQATPASAVGILDRAKRAVVIGDSRQLTPIVPMPAKLCEHLRKRARGVAPVWSPAKSSLQILSDLVMPWGTTIRDAVTGESVWTGFPLRTHLRCGSPMFDIANAVSYDGQMVQMTPRRDAAQPELSCWIDVDDTDATGGTERTPQTDIGSALKKSKVNPAELEVLEGVLRGLNRDATLSNARIFVISPFRAVADAAQKLIEAHRWEERFAADTVHSFQGREADIVILVLGSVPGRGGARQRRWASNPANLINVAVTRAKTDLIIVGSMADWRLEPLFAITARFMRRGVLMKEEVFAGAVEAQQTANRLAALRPAVLFDETSGEAGDEAKWMAQKAEANLHPVPVPNPPAAAAAPAMKPGRSSRMPTPEAVARAVDAMRTEPLMPRGSKPEPKPESHPVPKAQGHVATAEKATSRPIPKLESKVESKPESKSAQDPLAALSKPIDDLPWTW